MCIRDRPASRHREPHHAAPCRGEGMTGSPPGPAPSRDPGLDESTIKPLLTSEEPPLNCLRRPHCSPTQAPASRPSGRYAVGLRPSLDPDAYFDVCAAVEDRPNLRSPTS